jgi:hypothetical protein
MFFCALHDDERALIDRERETPFSVAVAGTYRSADEAATPLSAAVAAVVGYLASLGIEHIRADEARGRVWVEREQSGLVYMRLMEQYRVRRDDGLNLVEIG